jgi:DNA-3-methyladenine glycosylase
MPPSAGERSAAPPPGAWRFDVPGGYFARPAEEVAPALLGTVVRSTVGGRVVEGRIVETEAYVGPEDPASHAARRIGRTARNRAMFGPPGTAYVYLIYGIHWCLNVVTSRVGDPQAVLVRALEPLSGRETMRARRGRRTDLANGPGRLCQALGISGELDGHDLAEPPLRLGLPPEARREAVGVSGRIGIRDARDWPLRFFLRANPHVSRGPHLPVEAPPVDLLQPNGE